MPRLSKSKYQLTLTCLSFKGDKTRIILWEVLSTTLSCGKSVKYCIILWEECQVPHYLVGRMLSIGL